MTPLQSPSLNFLPSPKATPECLSNRQMMRVAAGAESKDAFAAHLSTCPACKDKLEIEVQAFAEDARRDVPPQLLQALREAEERQAKLRWRMPMLLLPSFAAMALAAVFVLRIGLPEQNTLKGSTSILASVKRNGVFLLQDRDAQTIKDLQPGDTLSIHVVGNPHLIAYVQVAEEGVWKDFFRGEVPADGWLPFGLEVTEGEPTHLRIAVCSKGRSDNAAIDDMSPAECTRVALEL